MMKAIGMQYPLLLVSFVFLSLLTLTGLANAALIAQLTGFDHKLGMTINNARFSLMDSLSPHIANFYFWIPFYCCLILLLAALDRVKFMRTFLFIGAYLLITGCCASLLNTVGSHMLPGYHNSFHYNYTSLAKMDHSLICVNAALSFGAAIFISIFLNQRFNLVKAALLFFSMVIIYNLIYLGDDLPLNLLLGMLAGLASAFLCRFWFKSPGAESTMNKLLAL
jgi:hypothetical protein